MQFLCDFGDFSPWSGGKTAYDRIQDAGKMDELESHLEEVFSGKTPTATEINDYLWFQPNDVYKALGMKPDEVNAKTAEELALEWCGDNDRHLVRAAIVVDALEIVSREIDGDGNPIGGEITDNLGEDELKEYMIEDNVELNAKTGCVEYW